MNKLCNSLKSVHLTTRNVRQINKLLYSTNFGEEKIVIPKRIHRGPTDILMALSSTVGRDPTAAHYKYHDDPFLIPLSNIGKRTFALAQEAGRKAARWIRQENTELFQHKLADPQIEAYVPQMVYKEDSQVEETDLKTLIKNVEVSDAILVYNLLQQNNIEVSEDVKQSLLELICFYNHEDTLNDEFIEERWFMQGMKQKERARRTWKDAELAEKLFTDVETKESKHYCAIIRGMAKYIQSEKAYAFYAEALDKRVPLDVTTFNSILSLVPFLKDGAELRWEMSLSILHEMNQQRLKPNLGTLNAVLETITMGGYRQTKPNALKTLAEFKRLGVEPSLASYYYVLIAFCRERGPVSHVLIDIMNLIEDKEFKIQDPKDTFFFVTAMDVCRHHLNDKELAKRVDKMLHYKDNYNLLGDSYKESIYYRNFMALLCSTEPLDVFMDTYNILVPHIYTPEPGVMEEVLKAINLNGAIEHVPLIWSHMLMFDHTNRESLLSGLLKIMVNNPPTQGILTHEGLDVKFGKIAWDLFSKVEENQSSRTRQQQLSWSGAMLGDILFLCCKANDLEHAPVIFDKLNKEQHKIIGEPSVKSLEAYIKACVSDKKPSLALTALQYCVENGFGESREFGKFINDKMTLDGPHLAKLVGLVGADALKERKIEQESS